MIVWRIASRRHAPLDGEGARRYGSRWTPRGVPVVFASRTLSLAALERLVHADPDLQPDDLSAIALEVDDRIAATTVHPADLPGGWRQSPPPTELSTIGARWARDAATVLLWVPSAVIPAEPNVLINPAHREFAKVRIVSSDPFGFDQRLWKQANVAGRPRSRGKRRLPPA